MNALNAISAGVVMPVEADASTEDGSAGFEQLLAGTLSHEPVRDADRSGSGELPSGVAVSVPARVVVVANEESAGLLDGLPTVEQLATVPTPRAIDAPSVDQPSLPELPGAAGAADEPDWDPTAPSAGPVSATVTAPSPVPSPTEPSPPAGATHSTVIEPMSRLQPERSRVSQLVGEPVGPDRRPDTGAAMHLTSGTGAHAPSGVDPSPVLEVRRLGAAMADTEGASLRAVAGEPALVDGIDAPVTSRPGAPPPTPAVGPPNPPAPLPNPAGLDVTQPALPVEPEMTDPNVARLSGAVRTIQRGEVRVTTVSLRPAELGHIRVELHDDGGSLVLRLVPSTPEARDLIRQAEGTLRRELAVSGVQLDRIDVDLRGGGGGSGLHRRDVPASDREAPPRWVDPAPRPTLHPIRSRAASRHHGLDVDL